MTPEETLVLQILVACFAISVMSGLLLYHAGYRNGYRDGTKRENKYREN